MGAAEAVAPAAIVVGSNKSDSPNFQTVLSGQRRCAAALCRHGHLASGTVARGDKRRRNTADGSPLDGSEHIRNGNPVSTTDETRPDEHGSGRDRTVAAMAGSMTSAVAVPITKNVGCRRERWEAAQTKASNSDDRQSEFHSSNPKRSQEVSRPMVFYPHEPFQIAKPMYLTALSHLSVAGRVGHATNLMSHVSSLRFSPVQVEMHRTLVRQWMVCVSRIRESSKRLKRIN